jgi:hypothetical protein
MFVKTEILTLRGEGEGVDESSLFYSPVSAVEVRKTRGKPRLRVGC